MKKIFQLVLLLGFMGLTLASCDEDYKDWAGAQTTTPESAITIPGYQATGVSAIDLKQVTTDDVTIFNLSSATLPAGFELKDVRIELSADEITTTTINTTNDGKAEKTVLKNFVEKNYGKDPIARSFVGHVFASAIKDGEAVLVDAGKVDVTLTSPGLVSSYKLVINDGEAEFPLANNGSSAYDDPNFKGTITTTNNNSTWQVVAEDGEVLASGKIENAGKYIFSVDVKTDKAEVNKAPSFLYMKGDANGWDGYDVLECVNEEGTQFRGFMYLNQNGFKFCTQKDWNGTNYGEDFKTEGNPPNITMTDPAGYYEVVVDLSAKTYTLTPITTIGIIGTAAPNGWDSDVDLTYNVEERCWEIKNVELKEGECKFRANDDWKMQWGFDGEKFVFSNNAPQNQFVPEAGTYDIKLFAWINGYAKCEFTKK